MPFITASKSAPLNWLEGFALTTILQGFPIFAAASLMVKLLGDSRGSSPVLTIALASIFYSCLAIWAGSTFARFAKNAYEPLFFDASLSMAEKVMRWRTQPMASLQLLANMVMMSVLGVAVLSVG